MNQALVVLLSKKPGSRNPTDFRPITLLNSAYKMIDKLIEARLAREVRQLKVMHPAQAGFMEGRATADQIFHLETII
ncbi:unnamed protein product [Blepharisma stoltei]|uniref:Reverse transcriptase domain-containing protein n=1 Tax=Blepharisma stoltei TaxID=1481888 RepID=A0AAU9JHS2_9CILI|nr:unnamed protein product [Blepharisma stoltei]